MKLQMPKFFRTIFFISLIFVVVNTYGQITNAAIQDIKLLYPNETIIQLGYGVKYDISSIKDEIKIRYSTNEQILFLGNASHIYSDRSIYSSTQVKAIKIEANSYIPNGSKYKKIELNDFKQIDRADWNVFHDDLEAVNITFPSINNGTVIELNTTYEVTDPQFVRTVLLQHYLPTYQLNVDITYDNNIDLELLYFNADTNQYKFTKTQDKKRTNLHYGATQVKERISEDNSPDYLYYVPHIYPLLKSITNDGFTKVVAGSPSDLYKRYYQFIKDIDTNIDLTELKAVADSITQNTNNEFEMVQQLYYWVQENTKYIAFEDGLGGFIPRTPDLVLKRRYGDCKDKATLLYELLKQKGITSHLTWVGTRDLPYSYSQLPTVGADNHMILTYIYNNQYYFLDATSKLLSIKYPSSFIQGKDALYSINSTQFKIVSVPILTPEQNSHYDSVYLNYNNKQLIGNGTAYYLGVKKRAIELKAEINDEKERKNNLEAGLQKGSNNFVLSDYSISKPNYYTDTAKVTYSFTLNNYVKSVDNEIYLNLNLSKNMLNYKIDNKRITPYEFENQQQSNFVFVFKLPPSYYCASLPDNVFFDNELMSFSIKYELVNNSIIYTHQINTKTLLIYPQQFEQWRTCINELEKNYKETLLLNNNEKN